MKKKPATPPAVKRKVAGRLRLKPGRLSKVLGPTAYQVWVAFIWRRDTDGLTFATCLTVAKLKRLSYQRTYRACKRLVAAGLLTKVEWKNCPRANNERRYARYVYGDYRNGMANIPNQAKEKLESLPQRGGKRKGAGRPKNQTDKSKPKSKRLTERIKVTNEKNQTEALKNTSRNTGSFINKRTRADEQRGGLLSFEESSPPFPSNSLIGVAKIPAPPLLPAMALYELDAVRELATAYRAALESRYDKKCFVFLRGDIRNSKHWKMLCESAKLLQEFRIAPMAWVAWSCDKWREGYGYEKKNPKKKFPPVAWVYSPKRIDQRKGWFDRERISYSGGRILFTAEHKDLLKRYDGFRRELAQFGEDSKQEILERWYPGGWRKLYAKAKQEAENNQSKLDYIVSKGDFIW